MTLQPALFRSKTALSAALFGLALSSCASYPERTQSALSVFQSGRFREAADLYGDVETTGSTFLSGAEGGAAAFAAGDWDKSLELYGRAANFAREVEDSALVSSESLAQSLLSFAVSESASDYEGEGYERVQLHAGMAMAYLAKGAFESARVEVRRANGLLESEEELYETEYAAGGLGHFISAVTYELEGGLDDAWIDYQRLRSKGTGAELAERALVRIARLTGREEEIPELMSRYAGEESPPSDAANVVVIAGLGLGPYKQAATLPIPTGDGILQWSVPAYFDRPQNVPALALASEGLDSDHRATVSTSAVEDVGRVAKENLEDRLLWLSARSAIRAFAKRELTQELEHHWGGWGRVLGDAFTYITERADLRTWQTLPSTWQAARLFLEPGEHSLVLAGGGYTEDLGRYEVAPGETMFVFARQVGGSLVAHTVGGRPITQSESDVLIPAPIEYERGDDAYSIPSIH